MKTYLEEAQELYEQGKRDEAFRVYKNLLTVNPDIPEVWYGIAKCIDNIDQKVLCIQKSLELNPDFEYAKEYLEILQSVKNTNKKTASNFQEISLIESNDLTSLLDEMKRGKKTK